MLLRYILQNFDNCEHLRRSILTNGMFYEHETTFYMMKTFFFFTNFEHSSGSRRFGSTFLTCNDLVFCHSYTDPFKVVIFVCLELILTDFRHFLVLITCKDNL